MWNFGMYEWMASERIAIYQREAALDRLRFDAAKPRRGEAPAAVAMTCGAVDTPGARSGVPSGRRALAAAFVGFAAMAVLRRRR